MGKEDKGKVVVSQPPIPGLVEAVDKAVVNMTAEEIAAFKKQWEVEQAEKRDDKNKGKYGNY